MDDYGNGAAISDGEDEFFPGLNSEGGEDANLEWLSMLVEDCLSAAPSYAAIAQHRPPPPPPATATAASLPTQVPLQPSPLPETRKRKLPAPPLLLQQQRYWPADSELLLQHVSMSKKVTNFVSGDDEMGKGQQSRRCTHCQAQKTPQWRTGPMGPKSLCNACGVRFKSGRLLPEYRPAKSPTFVSHQHSNSHKKVLEMRKRMMSSQESNSDRVDLGFHSVAM